MKEKGERGRKKEGDGRKDGWLEEEKKKEERKKERGEEASE